jgi:hypothetical protein
MTFFRARDRTTLNALARSLKTDPRRIESLCRLHGVDVVRIEGVAFIPDADVLAVREYDAAWRRRPTAKLLRLRPKRSYAPWRTRAGDDGFGLTRRERCQAALQGRTSRRAARLYRSEPDQGHPPEGSVVQTDHDSTQSQSE